MSNLLENAARHSGGAAVAVRAHAQGSRVVLRIIDQGPGIAAADLERIFDPFYRGADASGTGSGLGLAIAKGLIEANGGRLWARSLPGQGATFGVDLPVAVAAASPEHERSSPSPPRDAASPPRDPAFPPRDPASPSRDRNRCP